MLLSELWHYKQDDSILGMAFGDVNGNQQSELIVYTKTGKLIILSFKGDLLFEDEISDDSSIWCIKLLDIDDDGAKEIILGGLDGLLRTFKCDPETYELKPLWAHQFGSSIGGILVDNINQNKKRELIVYSLDKSIRVINSLDGSLIWGQSFEDGIGDACVWKNDDLSLYVKEIFACGNDGTIRVFTSEDGKLLWFKRYFEKMRCISGLNSSEGPVMLCGGDDNALHIIDKADHIELKSIEFEDYVWKILSFPTNHPTNALISTYSFAYFDDSVPIEEIEFTSKLSCLDENLDTKWEIKGKNIESLTLMEKQESTLIFVGTTKGDIIIVAPETGKILLELKRESCVNMVLPLAKKNIVFSCHDDGQVNAFFFEEF